MGSIPAGQLVKTRRSDNRYDRLLKAAARLFHAKGFDGTSMRDIASECGMLPGSVYYHFSSKEDLLAAVHEEGIRQISARVQAAAAAESDPWRRLRAAARAHMEAILDRSDFAAVVIRVMPARGEALYGRLAALREEYERIFRDLIAALPIAPAGRKPLRLALLGALNWSQTWYRPNGRRPAEIADDIVDLFEHGEAQ